MPCCIAIIHFLECRHSNLFKLGCTADCGGLCDESAQQTLLVTRYLWSCEECQQRRWTQSDEECLSRLEAEEQENKENIPNNGTTATRETSMRCKREALEERRREATRLRQVEETQWVAEWTLEYGLMAWDVLHERAWSPPEAARRIRKLRAFRLWDLAVTKDALRSPRDLRLAQTRGDTVWITGDWGRSSRRRARRSLESRRGSATAITAEKPGSVPTETDKEPSLPLDIGAKSYIRVGTPAVDPGAAPEPKPAPAPQFGAGTTVPAQPAQEPAAAITTKDSNMKADSDVHLGGKPLPESTPEAVLPSSSSSPSATWAYEMAAIEKAVLCLIDHSGGAGNDRGSAGLHLDQTGCEDRNLEANFDMVVRPKDIAGRATAVTTAV